MAIDSLQEFIQQVIPYASDLETHKGFLVSITPRAIWEWN